MIGSVRMLITYTGSIAVQTTCRIYQIRSDAGLKGKQEFRRTDFGSRLLAAEGDGGGAL
jgi:hypothetical protein